MKLALLVYLANVSEGISVLFGLLGVACIISFGFALVNKWCVFDVYDGNSEQHSNERKKAKASLDSTSKFALIGGLMILLAVLIPSEKTIYIMAGAYATEQIATNDRVQKIGNDVLEVIESKLDKMKEDK